MESEKEVSNCVNINLGPLLGVLNGTASKFAGNIDLIWKSFLSVNNDPESCLQWKAGSCWVYRKYAEVAAKTLLQRYPPEGQLLL